MNILTYAAVDIGSNAIRLLINTIYESETEVTFNKTSLVRVPVRLGQDVFTKGKISDKNITRLSDTMTAFRLLMKIYNVDKYRVFATSAMRDAKNSEKVLKTVKEKSDIQIEIISGEEEAEIIFSSELNRFSVDNTYYLFVDVGGGSTEISLLNKGTVLESRSFQMGTVRFLDGKVDDSYLKNEVKPWIKKVTAGKHIELIGSGGNINFVFKNSGKKDGQFLSDVFLQHQYNELKVLSVDERMQKYNMKPDRADVIVPALNIYSSVMRWSKAHRIHVPKIGAADGMITLMYKKSKKS